MRPHGGIIKRDVAALEAECAIEARSCTAAAGLLSVRTRCLGALRHVLAAVLALVSVEADARVIVDCVYACGVVHTGVGGALVNVELAMLTLEAGAGAYALVGIDAVLALASMQARFGLRRTRNP